jgi:hypothetical protein
MTDGKTKVSISWSVQRLGNLQHTLIEGSRVATARPRVRDDDFLRGVRDGRWEITTLEERNVETQAEHVLKTIVDVNPTFVLFF